MKRLRVQSSKSIIKERLLVTSLFHFKPAPSLQGIFCQTTLLLPSARSFSSRRSLYDELEVSHKATSDEIKLAYQKRVKETHPDSSLHNSNQTSSNTESFLKVREAFNVLSNPSMKREYDLSMGFVDKPQTNPSKSSRFDDIKASMSSTDAGVDLSGSGDVGGSSVGTPRNAYRERLKNKIPRNERERREKMHRREQPVQSVSSVLGVVVPALGMSTWVTSAMFF